MPGHRNNILFELAKELHSKGTSRADILSVLMDRNGSFQQPLPEPEVTQIANYRFKETTVEQ
ncbi:hypothetical protein EN989_11220 [Mesorhizobium sp. M7A.F.Ca.CA.002.12.1.1]|nr:hypothetical protein EN989_11220 [Mesorhizobium sp. M7A.F.Ca.CA.002.12.1.1]